jgi:short-subunit dehydrogenase
MNRTTRTALWTGAGLAGFAAASLLWQRQRRAKSGFPLHDRTVLITGGSRGLGFALAEQFLRHGSRVALIARNSGELQTAAERLAPLGSVATFAADLTQLDGIPDLVARIRQQMGPIDVLVNNAGIIQVGPWQELQDDDFRHAMDLHFWAPLALTRAVLPDMLTHGAGRIVNISSIGGIIAVPHLLSYSASKFALEGLSEGWHAELRKHGIRLTVVCPWLMRTGSQERALLRGKAEDEFAWFAAAGATPLTAQSATAAARIIVRATRRGTPRVVLSLRGKLAALAHGAAPNQVIQLMSVADRLLPRPTPGSRPSGLQKGEESYNRWSRLLLRPLIRRAGARWNQPAA